MLYFHISRVKRAHAHVKQSDGRTVIMDGKAWVKATDALLSPISDIKLRMTSRVRPNFKEADPKNCTHAIALISDHRTGSFHSIEAGQVKKRDNASRAFFSGVRIFSTLIA